jgi:OFA family oxalate/formate antiporter-like MFS transporter
LAASAADYFGPKNVGPIYGLMLTAWGFASAFGPLLIAHMRETAGSHRGALHVIAGVMAISTLLPILLRPPRIGGLGAGQNRIISLPKEGGPSGSSVVTKNPSHTS